MNKRGMPSTYTYVIWGEEKDTYGWSLDDRKDPTLDKITLQGRFQAWRNQKSIFDSLEEIVTIPKDSRKYRGGNKPGKRNGKWQGKQEKRPLSTQELDGRLRSMAAEWGV